MGFAKENKTYIGFLNLHFHLICYTFMTSDIVAMKIRQIAICRIAGL